MPDRDDPRDRSGDPTLGEVLAEIRSETEERSPVSSEATAERLERAFDRDRLRVLLFSQGGSRFAAEIERVLEVSPVPDFTPVPGVPGWVKGIANFRGEIISIVALGELLGLGPSAVTSGSRRLLVAQALGEPVRSGLIVDGVHGNLRVSRDELRPLAGRAQQGLSPYLSGLLQAKGELHALLDVERLLLSDDFRIPGDGRRRSHGL
ncbi:MAG: chemotaxis protein CheW [Acidobacteriota bacterium]|jgi:chemotaxis signal transduction protein